MSCELIQMQTNSGALGDMGGRNVHKSNNVAQTSTSISLPQPTGSLPTSRNNKVDYYYDTPAKKKKKQTTTEWN